MRIGFGALAAEIGAGFKIVKLLVYAAFSY
jgi:hypothetical protein